MPLLPGTNAAKSQPPKAEKRNSQDAQSHVLDDTTRYLLNIPYGKSYHVSEILDP